MASKETNEINRLKKEIERLKKDVKHQEQLNMTTQETNMWLGEHPNEIPQMGCTPRVVKEVIENNYLLDFKPRLNTSSYVNVEFEPEEEDIAMLGLKVNLADQTVYPQSFKLHNSIINMIADLWHCPKNDEFEKYGVQAGAGTVGSTEACLLAGLALRARWRKWYAKKHKLSADEVAGIKPNIVISSLYQAAWEKLIKYMDIDCKLIQPSVDTFKIDPNHVKEAIDDKTMGVICILGNHYGGHYDRVDKINDIINEVNNEKGYQVAIHVDAASGGFIAPFQKDMPAWDFRLNNVLSISASGHKYGESCCGTGWLVWRQRKDLSEYIAISISYLGGLAESYTLNFSRPASGVYVQYYKLIRLGIEGYTNYCDMMMGYADRIRKALKAMTYNGKPRFKILDDGNKHCLPVVAAMLNTECDFGYNDIDLQNALAQNHWYVSAYGMYLENPLTREKMPLFNDQPSDQTMFRIVIKANFTDSMVQHLIESFEHAFNTLDNLKIEFTGQSDTSFLRNKDQIVTNHC